VPYFFRHFSDLLIYSKIIINTQTIDAKEAPSRAKQLVKCGDILVSTVRPNLNAVAVIQKDSDHVLVASTGYCVLRCNSNTDNHYVFHFCQSPYFIDNMVRQATGASYPAVSNSIVKGCLIPSRSYEEQQHIADVLDKVSDLISLRKQQLANLNELVKVRFVEMFGEISFNTKEYQLKKLGDIAFITKLAGFEYTEHIKYQDHGDIIMVRGLNCRKTKLVLDNIYWIDQETSDKLPRSKLFAGDILMTYVGTVGEVALIDVDNRYHLAPNVAKISLNNKSLHIPQFFVYMFMYCRDYIMKHASSTTQAALSMSKIRDIDFPIPPTALQAQFASFVEQIDRQKLTIQQSLDKLEVLKKSLMQEYFG